MHKSSRCAALPRRLMVARLEASADAARSAYADSPTLVCQAMPDGEYVTQYVIHGM